MEVICDFCGTDKDVYRTCDGCNQHICYDCKSKHAKGYRLAYWTNSSNDALYCFACIGKLVEKKDPLFHAYLAIETLGKEYANWYEDFKKRADVADELVVALAKGSLNKLQVIL